MYPVIIFYLLAPRENPSHDDAFSSLAGSAHCRDTMLSFMVVSVLLTHISTGAETDGILNVAEAPQDVRDEFEELALLSKTVTTSDWCEVIETG